MKLINNLETDNKAIVNLHEGHRERLRKRLADKNFIEDDYQILEYLLTLPVMRRDTNGLAHKLINEFGTLANVLDSKIEDLLQVKGISPTIAYFLHSLPFIFRNYKFSKMEAKPVLTNPRDIFNYLGQAIHHLPIEEFYLICLDNSYKVINKKIISSESSDNVAIDIKNCVQFALQTKASKVIMVHNHPTSGPEPSKNDLETTKRMFIGFESSGIELHDHVIVNYNEELYSFSNSGLIKNFKDEYLDMLKVK